MSIHFIELDYKTCKYGKITWTHPKTKESFTGDKVPMLFIEDYLVTHKDIIKQYKIKVIDV